MDALKCFRMIYRVFQYVLKAMGSWVSLSVLTPSLFLLFFSFFVYSFILIRTKSILSRSKNMCGKLKGLVTPVSPSSGHLDYKVYSVNSWSSSSSSKIIMNKINSRKATGIFLELRCSISKTRRITLHCYTGTHP